MKDCKKHDWRRIHGGTCLGANGERRIEVLYYCPICDKVKKISVDPAKVLLKPLVQMRIAGRKG